VVERCSVGEGVTLFICPKVARHRSDATYRENACRIQKAIVKANGLSAAADLIEHSLGVPTKIRRRQMELV
jgi:hypothetical protein